VVEKAVCMLPCIAAAAAARARRGTVCGLVFPECWLTCCVMLLGVVDDGALCVLHAGFWRLVGPEAESVWAFRSLGGWV
jgi:hypothetical protein